MATKLQISGLEFEDIKTNLKNYLKEQTIFKDYNFQGSALNILLDTLVYNTYYNSFYLNMIANEMTLDTATLRDSILAHAKSLNYTPSSKRCPIALVDITVTPPGGNTQSLLTLNRFSEFQSESIDGVNYSFVNTEAKTSYKEDGVFSFKSVELYQGDPQSLTFNYNSSTQSKPEFEIPHIDIDTNTIKVLVQASEVNTSVEVFTLSTDITNSVNGSVYFLSSSADDKYKIVFGDGRVSKALSNGNIILVSYLTTSGEEANKANNFATSSIGGFSNVSVISISEAAGGTDKESDTSIKSNAPLFNASQNRGITPNDFAALLLKYYPAIKSVSVWGGEDEDPPIYDTIFITYLTKNNFIINDAEKERIINNILKPLSIINVNINFIDPDFTYLKIYTSMKVNEKSTTLSTSQIETLIYNTIKDFIDNNLNTFQSTFASSKLESKIDNSLPSIIGSDTTIKVEKRLSPVMNVTTNYELNYNIPLKRSTATSGLSSSGFYVYDNLNIKRLAYIEEVFDSFTGVDEIKITNPGFGYTEAPTVTITGDGTGAQATATIVNGKINSITLTNRGTGYTTAAISFSGGNGSLAQATAVVASKYGTLRLYYSKSNAEKETIISDIGTINYETGKITISNLNVESTTRSDGKIKFIIEPETFLIETKRNQLLVLDDADSSSIQIDISMV